MARRITRWQRAAEPPLDRPDRPHPGHCGHRRDRGVGLPGQLARVGYRSSGSLSEACPSVLGHGQGCARARGTQAGRVDRDQAIRLSPRARQRNRQRIWAYHDGVDLGRPAMARIAKDYGYTMEELRKL